MEDHSYWDARSKLSVSYKGEEFYTITPLPYYWRRREMILRRIKDILDQDAIRSVCDFGCGDGWYTGSLARAEKKLQFFGLDLSDGMIDRALHEYRDVENIKFIAGEFNEIYGEGVFGEGLDFIYALAVFAHISDEQLRTLFQAFFGSMTDESEILFFEQVGAKRVSGESYIRRTASEYIQMAEEAGFQMKECAILDSELYRLLFERKVSKIFLRFFSHGSTDCERRINLNRNRIYIAISEIILKLCPLKWKKWIGFDTWGYALLRFGKS